MGRPFVSYGRFVAVAVAVISLAANLGSQRFHPLLAVAQAARPADAALAPAPTPDSIEAADTLELTGLQHKFEAVARQVSPSVVAISATISGPTDTEAGVRSNDLNPEKLQSMLDRTTRTVGTGFVFDSGGYILTNEHVVADAQQLWVTTDDHKVYPAIVVGSDPRADLAVMKIPAAHLPVIKWGDGAAVPRGQWTIAIGNPFGLATEGEMCMSVGVVSATHRSLPKLATKENRLYSDLIQTTAQINPGNSGGPLFDLAGSVIGINTAVILPQKQTNGIGFAIPVTSALMTEARELMQGKEVVYGYLGVTSSIPSNHERVAAGITPDAGVRVDSVEPESPAATGGIAPGDYIVTINGSTVHDSEQFVRMIGVLAVDHPASIGIYHNGKPSVQTVLPKRRETPTVAVNRDNQRLRWRGMLLGPVPANWCTTTAGEDAHPHAGLLVVGLENDSPLKAQGIAQGSVITSVAGRAVSTIVELQRILNDVPEEKCTIETNTNSATVVSIETHATGN